MFGPFAYAQPAIAVKSLEIAPEVPPAGPGTREERAVKLTAAPDGILAAILSALGLGKTTTLTITNHRITRVDLGSNVMDTNVLPISKVSSIHYGRSKPVALLIMGIFFGLSALAGLLAGGIGGGMGPLFICLVSLAIYFTSGITYTILFGGVGALGVSMKLKTKEPQELDKVCELVNQLVQSSAHGVTTGAIRPRGAMVDASA